MPTPQHKMKTGTLLCWLFGHKFINKVKNYKGGDSLVSYYETSWHKINSCIRCGIDKHSNE